MNTIALRSVLPQARNMFVNFRDWAKEELCHFPLKSEYYDNPNFIELSEELYSSEQSGDHDVPVLTSDFEAQIKQVVIEQRQTMTVDCGSWFAGSGSEPPLALAVKSSNLFRDEQIEYEYKTAITREEDSQFIPIHYNDDWRDLVIIRPNRQNEFLIDYPIRCTIHPSDTDIVEVVNDVIEQLKEGKIVVVKIGDARQAQAKTYTKEKKWREFLSSHLAYLRIVEQLQCKVDISSEVREGKHGLFGVKKDFYLVFRRSFLQI